jgi:NADH-quinone oxidoreductase subunit M
MDLTKREYSMLLPLAITTIIFGIMPQLLLNYINPFAKTFVDLVLNNH